MGKFREIIAEFRKKINRKINLNPIRLLTLHRAIRTINELGYTIN